MWFVCLSVCLPAFLSVCLFACLCLFLLVCLFACLSVYMPVCLSVHLSICLFAEEAIQNFMSYYRRVFPEASVTVKLHMMEEHLVPFLKKWKGIGFGLMAEQGAESIHHEFNDLTRRFASIPDTTSRLGYVLREHHLRCCPVNRDAKPVPKKRKL